MFANPEVTRQIHIINRGEGKLMKFMRASKSEHTFFMHKIKLKSKN